MTEFQRSFDGLWKKSRETALKDARSLSYIRRSAATDAINATSLAAVVQALRTRNIPIRCHRIPDGQPRRFTWQKKEGRFIPGSQLSGDSVEMMLLGPSEGLVRKHWDRLPIGKYAAFALSAALPVKSITPSNQLSYVIRIGFEGQGILIAGDAGCVDFKAGAGRGTYFPELLKPLLPLHVIQVAHHGGNNAHFYNTLLAAGYPDQQERSYLLLSHAFEDRYRPSLEFGQFIEQARKDGDDMQLLFTSQPKKKKVLDYVSIIHPSVGPKGTVGDIRIVFADDTWNVSKHAVQVQ